MPHKYYSVDKYQPRKKQKYVNENNTIGTPSFTIIDGTKFKVDLVKSFNIDGAFNIIPCCLVLSLLF
jgi:hypothetical protein